MVKTALKAAGPSERVLQRCLMARQLGLKLIANVTYGARYARLCCIAACLLVR